MKYSFKGKVKIDSRSLIGIFLAILIFGFLYVKIFGLQIIQGSKYYLIASKTNQSQVKIPAPRGIIYDNNGIKLAFNTLSYSIYVKTSNLKSEDETSLFNLLAGYIGGKSANLLQNYRTAAYDSNGVKKEGIRVTISNNVNYDQYINLLTNADKFSTYGVYFTSEPLRYYSDPVALANIMGYVGDPSLADIKRGINSDSQVGKDGLESYDDQYLRGEDGIQISQRDPLTKQLNTYTTQEVQPGENLVLTIDSKWQEALYTSLKNRVAETNSFGGAGVIVNSKTGEVKAMVTYPTYNSNQFTQGISYSDYQVLINDIRRPLFDRPIALQLPPGSTWKIFGATAALESGVVDENYTFFSNRCMDLPGNKQICEADKSFLGNVNIKQALAYSSNLYFCNAAILMDKKYGGPDYLLNMAKEYQLGQKTGIDLYGEASGTLPSPELELKNNGSPWYIGDDCNTIIGQGLDTVTPLQMAMGVSAISNGGNLMKPYIVSSVTDSSGDVVKNTLPEVRNVINASQSTFDIIKKGMKLAVNGGTASGLNSLPGNFIAKTGSSDASEVINGKTYSGAHSWTVGCFDYQGQNYCFTVMLQWGGRGYKSVPIMKNFINCLYSDFKGYCTTDGQ